MGKDVKGDASSSSKPKGGADVLNMSDGTGKDAWGKGSGKDAVSSSSCNSLSYWFSSMNAMISAAIDLNDTSSLCVDKP